MNENTLRGSGGVLTHAAGAILGIIVNEELTFQGDHGDAVIVTFPESSIVGPSIGSIRLIAERLSAKKGDYLTLVLDRNNWSAMGRLTVTTDLSESWQCVGRLTGLEEKVDLASLANALQCEAREVREVLAKRGDIAVLDSLPQMGASFSLDQALAALEAQIELNAESQLVSFDGHFTRVLPVYQIPDQDLVGEVLVPAMSLCDEVRIEAGFFSSRCLAQIAPGLASFVNETSSSLKLMASPEVSLEDQKAIRRGVRDPQSVLDEAMVKLFEEARLSESAIERHTVDTLAYLVASRRLLMRVVLMERGMYHRKIWLFGSGDKWLAVHGSGNATERGLLVNGEQMSIDRPWMEGGPSEKRVGIFLDQWERRWNNQSGTSLAIEVDRAIALLRDHAQPDPPSAADFWQAWRKDRALGLEPELPPGYAAEPMHHRLSVPMSLEWRDGKYAHQGRAVDALLAHAGVGILSIATGGGKTRTALIATAELQHFNAGHLCVVIVAPSRPLVRQWTRDVLEFGINPIVLTGMNPTARLQELERLSIAFRTARPRTEVLIMTNALFAKAKSKEREWLERLPDSVARVLIADEVHNFGSASFLGNQPEYFEHRIGLSATPVRQFDPDGTDRLFEYFGGPPVFEFSLRDAIASGCLVPYRYYMHVVKLNSAEMEYYEDLTMQLAKAGFMIDDDGRTVGLTQRVERLLRRRRALVEQASSKLNALEQILKGMNPSSITKTLIYTSGKETVPNMTKQITLVNRMLQNLPITSIQLTSQETGSSRARAILSSFGTGDYQILTSMKVLDEGIDIPQTDTAFLLASSTVRREWIQRRGRILRNAPGKSVAHLHDFIVIPPDAGTPSGASLLRSELRRAYEFADLAENEFDAHGPNSTIRNLEALLRTA